MKNLHLCLIGISLVFGLLGCASTTVRVDDVKLTTQEAEQLIAKLNETNAQQLAAIRKLQPESFEAVGMYRIKPGDTCVKIAAAHGLAVTDLQALNPTVDWAKLHVWQVIRIKAAANE
jgi:LysM repeat protein